MESTYSQVLLAERTYTDGRGEVSKYVYGNGLIGEEKTADETKEYATYLYNHLGSTTAVTDENGTVIETYDYGAYGELLTDSMGTRRFLYNGQLGVIIDDNGLYHMRARYYNTDIKRFISRDIVSGDITNSQSLNRYCYVQGNPLSYTDPFGLSPESMWNQTGHAILDVLGFIPVIGVFADIANGIWYLKEGKIFEAACCFVSAVPGAGDLLGKGLKAAGKLTKGLCTANKLSRAGDLLKLGAQVAGNAGSLALSGAIIWDNATNIGNYLAGNEYKYDVWDSVSAIGFALIGAVLGAKGLEDSGKAFKDFKKGSITTSGCFIAGTLVLTADGCKAIEDIEEGDKVLAENAETGEQDEKKVVTLYRHEKYLLIHVQTEDCKEVVTTKEHPFYVEGAGFVTAGSLKEGDVLLTADGQNLTIIKVEAECLDEPVTVYNFEVEDYHTYFVGENGLFVHNECTKAISSKQENGGSVVVNAGTPTKGASASWNGDKGFYSVIREVELPSDMYPGVSDARHFQEANKQLHGYFQANPDFAQELEKLYPGIIEGVQPGIRGAYPRKAPTPDVTWHHEAYRKGIMQLVPINQHTAKGIIQSILHPNGKGGMQNWGGGRVRKK